MAPLAVNRQSTVAAAVVRSDTQALTALSKPSASASRPRRQARASALNSISAIPWHAQDRIQKAASLGSVVELQPLDDAPGLLLREGLVQRCHAMRVQVVRAC